MIIWFITSRALETPRKSLLNLRPWRVRSLCKMWGVCQGVVATGWLNHHLDVNGPMAHLLLYHLKGSYHQVIKKLVAELDRSVLFVRASGFLRFVLTTGLLLANRFGFEWKGLASKKSRLERRCLPRQCGSWMNWLIHRRYLKPKDLKFSWNMLRNV